MTFAAQETAIASGRPERLYQFVLGTKTWAYTSAGLAVTRSGTVYAPVAISDNGIIQSGEASADQFQITAPASLAAAQLYRGAPPAQPVDVTVFARHRSDPDDEFITVWAGEIRTVKFTGIDRCIITCSLLTERLEMRGLRLCWERTCPHALYSPACGVSREAWRIEAEIASVPDGATITFASETTIATGFLTGGLIEWSTASYTERRGIEAHSGATITLLGGSAGLQAGMNIRLYPGCQQTVTACEAFANLDNYGGVPHMSGESPYGINPF